MRLLLVLSCLMLSTQPVAWGCETADCYPPELKTKYGDDIGSTRVVFYNSGDNVVNFGFREFLEENNLEVVVRKPKPKEDVK